MTFQVLLASFYHWGSDVKEEWLIFFQVTEEQLPQVLQECYRDLHWNNPVFPFTSILIDPWKGA